MECHVKCVEYKMEGLKSNQRPKEARRIEVRKEYVNILMGKENLSIEVDWCIQQDWGIIEVYLATLI